MRNLATSALFLLTSLSVAAQQPRLSCRDNNFQNDHLVTACEMKEMTVANAGRLQIDPGRNGGVTVQGADRSDILVRAAVYAAAETRDQAHGMIGQIRINANAGQLTAQ